MSEPRKKRPWEKSACFSSIFWRRDPYVAQLIGKGVHQHGSRRPRTRSRNSRCFQVFLATRFVAQLSASPRDKAQNNFLATRFVGLKLVFSRSGDPTSFLTLSAPRGKAQIYVFDVLATRFVGPLAPEITLFSVSWRRDSWLNLSARLNIVLGGKLTQTFVPFFYAPTHQMSAAARLVHRSRWQASAWTQ